MKTAVIIPTMDRNWDVMSVFWPLFGKQWQDCPWDVYSAFNGRDQRPFPPLLTQSRVYEVFCQDPGWAATVRELMRASGADRFLYLQDDYWLTKKVDTAELEDLARIMEELNGDYLRLYPHDGVVGYPNCRRPVGPTLPNRRYSISLQASLWTRSFLEKCLDLVPDIWAFEPGITDRIDWDRHKILSVADRYKPLDYICTAVVRGKYDPGAVEYCKKHGVHIPDNGREVWPCNLSSSTSIQY